MKQLQEGGWFSISPILLMHPMEKTEGGLSQVEERILQELALGAGARRAVIWVGQALTDQQVRDKCRRG
jgi:rod shape-determining protein MreB